MPNSFTDGIVAIGSAGGKARAQGSPELDRRVVSRPGEAVVAHARGRARDLRRAGSLPRGAAPAPGGPPRAGAALPPEARLPAARGRSPVLGRRPEFQPRLPRAPHGAAPPWQRGPAARARGPDLLPAARPLEAAVGDLDRARSRGRPLRADLEDASRARGRRVRRGHRDRAVRPLAGAGGARARRALDALARAGGRGPRGGGREGLIRTPFDLAGRAVGALQRPGETIDRVREAAEGLGEVVWAGMNPAPDVPLNVEIGPHRRLRWVQSRLSDFKEIKNALGGTVNDAVLAVVAGALGCWLRTRGVRTEGLELRALVPVSIRAQDEHGALGNRIAAMRGPLPVYVTDPVERLRLDQESMGNLKQSKQALGAEVIAGLQDFAPPTLLAQASRVNFSTRLFNL